MNHPLVARMRTAMWKSLAEGKFSCCTISDVLTICFLWSGCLVVLVHIVQAGLLEGTYILFSCNASVLKVSFFCQSEEASC